MKNILFLLLLLGYFSCTTEQTNSANSNQAVSNSDLDWLVGFWARKNDKAGQKTFEYWAKKGKEQYEGMGYTLQNKDTIFKERLSLLKLEGVWNYEVTGVNNKPTYFVFTQQSEKRFVCENPKNEFPKKIKYWMESDQLNAKISAGKMEVSFLFEKMILK